MNIVVPHLGVELTQKCNLDCRHCFRGESHNVNISKEVLEKIFNEIKYVGTLDLSGGEVFLAYDQLKLLLEIAKEKGCLIERCSMLINGTIYDQRIYDLLNQYFGNNYQIGISYDDFHDKSIERIYGNSTKNSNNSDLYPCNKEEVMNNMKRHMFDIHSIGFRRVSNHLIENGRALSVDTPHKKFEALGYYFTNYKNTLLVGPMVFIGADGYISDINSDISKRNDQSIGNVLENSISSCVLKGGIELECNDYVEFFEMMIQREHDFATHQGDHLNFKNGKMVDTIYEPDVKFIEEMNKCGEIVKGILKCKDAESLYNYINTFDLSNYPGDLSQIDHDFSLKKENSNG